MRQLTLEFGVAQRATSVIERASSQTICELGALVAQLDAQRFRGAEQASPRRRDADPDE